MLLVFLLRKIIIFILNFFKLTYYLFFIITMYFTSFLHFYINKYLDKLLSNALKFVYFYNFYVYMCVILKYLRYIILYFIIPFKLLYYLYNIIKTTCVFYYQKTAFKHNFKILHNTLQQFIKSIFSNNFFIIAKKLFFINFFNFFGNLYKRRKMLILKLYKMLLKNLKLRAKYLFINYTDNYRLFLRKIKKTEYFLSNKNVTQLLNAKAFNSYETFFYKIKRGL